MTLMVWSFQTVRVFFLIKSLFVAIWQQFLKFLKVEKSLILRAFRGTKSDIKFEFYEDIRKLNRDKILHIRTVAKIKCQRTIWESKEYQEDRNFAPKEDKRDCPLTEQNPRSPLFTRVSGILFLPVMLQ